MIIRTALVGWKGNSKGGVRWVTTDSRVLERNEISLDLPRKSRAHTDPTELLAAAHASSFSLALSRELHLNPRAAGEIATSATVSAEHLAAGWAILNVHLNVIARLPKVSQRRFIDATLRAKTNCMVSRLLRATISMNARLEK